MKYRIKATRKSWDWAEETFYAVLVKYSWFPFWIQVTKRFEKLSQAEEYITLITKEYDYPPVKEAK